MKVVKYDCIDFYFFNLAPYHDLIYEKAQYYNDKSKLIPSKENIFIELLNHFLRNHLKETYLVDFKNKKILKDLRVCCRSPIEYFSEESLDLMMDLVRSEVWVVIEGVIPVTYRSYPLGYEFVHSGLLCIGVDKREDKYDNNDSDDVYYDGGFDGSDNEKPS